MKISDYGIGLLENFEGFKPKAYLCPAKVWTLGIGTTSVNGIPVKPGDVCTKAQAYQYVRDYFSEEIYPIFKDEILVPLTQNQFDALCLLAYNIGINAFKKSTLLKKLNNRDYIGASDEILRWNKVKGKAVKGLTLRREQEYNLFLKFSRLFLQSKCGKK